MKALLTLATLLTFATPSIAREVVNFRHGGYKYVVQSDLIDCRYPITENTNYDRKYRPYTHQKMCGVHGAKIDLAGNAYHVNGHDYCWQSYDGGYSWEKDYGSWMCKGIHMLNDTK